MVFPLDEAVTLCPPAVNAASVPNFWFEAQEPPSVQLSDSVAMAPAAAACGLREPQRLTDAV